MRPARRSPACRTAAQGQDGGECGDKPEGGSSAPDANIPTARHHPKDWSDVKIGSLFLASEGDNEGWWECAVSGIKEGEYALRWLHYPEEPAFTRMREQLGLLWAAPALTASN